MIAMAIAKEGRDISEAESQVKAAISNIQGIRVTALKNIGTLIVSCPDMMSALKR